MRAFAPLASSWLRVAASAAAQTGTATLNAAFTGLARLSLSTGSMTFPDADPDTVPQVPGNPPVSTSRRRRAPRVRHRHVIGAGERRPAVRRDTTPGVADHVDGDWERLPGGTLSAATPQTVASWYGSGVRAGTQSFLFRNLWTHPSGTYTLTLALHAERPMSSSASTARRVPCPVSAAALAARAASDLTVTPAVISFPRAIPTPHPWCVAAPVQVDVPRPAEQRPLDTDGPGRRRPKFRELNGRYL